MSSSSLSLLNTTPRVSVEASIDSDSPGLKTMLAEFFFVSKLLAKIQRSTTRITRVIIQGHSKQVFVALGRLKELLHSYYGAAIVWGEECAVAEEDRLNSITVEATLPEFKRDPSSGEFKEKDLDEISFGGSAATEAFKEFVNETLARMTNAATGFGIAKGWIPAVKEKHIYVKRGDDEYDLEVSKISTLPALIEAVQKKFPSAPEVKKLYHLRERNPVVVTDFTDLREGFLYYALAGFEELPKKQTTKFTTLQEFFDKLKTEEEMSDAQVEKAKDSFTAQGITFKQMMATGHLALTDEKLEKYGISQGGLRTAILSVIESNQ